jgi:hypothetical protein
VEEEGRPPVRGGLDRPDRLEPGRAQALGQRSEWLAHCERNVVEARPPPLEEAVDRRALPARPDELERAAGPEARDGDAARHERPSQLGA